MLLWSLLLKACNDIITKLFCLQEHHPWLRFSRICQQGGGFMVQARGACQLDSGQWDLDLWVRGIKLWGGFVELRVPRGDVWWLHWCADSKLPSVRITCHPILAWAVCLIKVIDYLAVLLWEVPCSLVILSQLSHLPEGTVPSHI